MAGPDRRQDRPADRYRGRRVRGTVPSPCHDGRVTTRPLLALAIVVGLLSAVSPPAVARVVAETAATGPGSGSAATTRVGRPEIHQRLIHFGAERKRQMARYSKLHYGKAQWRLEPQGIVQHYTATRSRASVFATFRANDPDPELGQRPGVCAHFVIDGDGTIYQLVPTAIRCRHTVGLNHRTIGVEHVAVSDEDVMGNRRQRAASLRLSAWLAQRHDIPVGDVIGHNESLRSRLHHELYRPWRCQTHGDFRRSTMDRYRRHLAERLAGTSVSTAPPVWRPTPC